MVSRKPNKAGRELSGRYVLLTPVAQGGMGEVWKARDKITGHMVAAKVLRTELAGEEISLSRLRLEAKNAMRAQHPNIAAVLDSGEEDQRGWIVMELVEGEPLTKYVGDGRTLTEGELVPLLIQTAYALDAAARAGVVHRDIKPANIIVRPDGKVKLTDFGVSLSDGQVNLTAAGMVMGTAQYLPPEQAMGKVATPVGDLYALGVVAFEAVAGHRPYTGKTQVDIAFAHVNEPVPPLPETVSEPLATLIYRLLEKDPETRPQTGAALARELVSVASALNLGTSPMPIVRGDAPEDPSGQADAAGPGGVDVPQPSPAAPVPPVTHVTKKHLPESAADAWHPVETRSFRHRLRPPADSPASPRRQRTRREVQAEAGKSGGPDLGMWVIVALVALTLVLIVIAMVRNYSQPAEDRNASQPVSAPSLFQEVEPWLSPTVVV